MFKRFMCALTVLAALAGSASAGLNFNFNPASGMSPTAIDGFQQAAGQLENTARMRAVKRDTARVLTILNEQAAAAAGEE